MDSSQTLHPDLKQIYEKIMSTPTSKTNTTPMASAPSAPMPATPPTPTTTPPSITPMMNMPVMASAAPPGAPVPTPKPQTPPPSPIQAAMPQAPIASSQPPKTTMNSFASVAPQPVKTANQVIFTNPQKRTGPTAAGGQTIIAHKGGGVSKVLVGFLTITFIIAYTFFWLLLFGYIDKSTFGL